MNDSRMNMDVILTSTLDGYLKNRNMVPSNVLNHATFTNFIKDEKTGKI